MSVGSERVGESRSLSRRRLALSVNSAGLLVAMVDFAVIEFAALISALAYHRVFLHAGANIRLYGIVAALCFVNFAAIQQAHGSYSFRTLSKGLAKPREIIATWLIVVLVSLSLFFALKVGASISRGAIFLFAPLALAGLVIWRGYVEAWLPRAREVGTLAARRAILIAERDELDGIDLARLEDSSDFEILTTLAFKGDSQDSVQRVAAQATQTARGMHAELVVILASWREESTIDTLASALRILPLPVFLLPDRRTARRLHAPGQPSTAAFDLMIVQRAPLSRGERALKRVLDLVVAAIGLSVLSPLLLLVAALVKLESRGPALFRQERSGFDGRPFRILKFRTMRVVEDGPDVRQATRDDPRTTKVGAWLRRTSVDELPQLWNVLRGEMSIVGPRPHAVAHTKQYEQLIGAYAFRHHVKPGLTGWAQVNGFRGATRTVDLMEKRVEHDLYYINHWSLPLDLSIMFRTARLALGDSAAY